MKTTSKEKRHTKHRGVSPILATVVLLAITVTSGGVVFALLEEGTSTVSASNIIVVENAQAIKGTDHADMTATIKNGGDKVWTKLQMTVAKSELSEPLLYESLHENVQGCDIAVAQADCRDDFGAAGGRDNPLRAQWIASLDRTGGEEDRADPGEGISVGRKFVFDKKDDYRTVSILPNTAVAPLFGGPGVIDSVTGLADNDLSALSLAHTAAVCTPIADTACGDMFRLLDPGVKGEVYCTINTDNPAVYADCDVYTHQSIKGKPVGPGETKYFYADTFTSAIPGLNNQFVALGDSLVVNLAADGSDDDSTVRFQTIIKVTGI